MKLDCNVFDLTVVTKRVFEGKKVNADGSKNIYYQIGVANGTDLESLGCTLDVYNAVELNKTYDFHFVFETRFDKVFIRFDSCQESPTNSKK